MFLRQILEIKERGLQKLKDYYLQQVDFERIEVPCWYRADSGWFQVGTR